MLSNLLVHTISTQRLMAGVGAQRKYQTNLTGLSCLIQPMTAENAAKVDMNFDKAYYMYTEPNVDIRTGDSVTDQDGTNYRVMGSMKRNYGLNPNMTWYLSEQAGDGVN